MKLVKVSVLVLWALFTTLFIAKTSYAASLSFAQADGKIISFKLAKLKSKLTTHAISLFDPHYAADKNYQAFALHDVLNLGFGKAWQQGEFADITFMATDGYQALGNIEQLKQTGGFIVYADIDHASWQGIGRAKASPGPFYLVWQHKDQSTQQGFPWPWALAQMSLVKFSDKYTHVYPQQVKTGSKVYQGYELFKQRCFRCHAMNQQGGKVGPDLNAPQNILAYRSEAMVKAFIKNPQQFRYTHMPSHLDLTEQQLNNLIEYLRHQGQSR